MSKIEQFEAMLAKGQDNALLRYTLGSLYLQEAQPAEAAAHLRAAVQHDQNYSAAWRALGKALTDVGELDEAIETYERGIEVASGRGDMQLVKEMQVFLRRARKQRDSDT